MPSWTRTPVVPGDRLMVEIPYTTRSTLRPLIGLLRHAKVLDHHRAIILNDDGTRYTVHGRPLPPVALPEVSIFTNPTTGGLWAHTYHLPPREHSPYPILERYAAVAEPDDHGGIARMRSCWCGGGCVCPTCGEPTIKIPTPSGLEWITRSRSGERHTERWCVASSCAATAAQETEHGPDCCALPMRLAPVGWVCNRESAHRRPYQWPDPTESSSPS